MDSPRVSLTCGPLYGKLEGPDEAIALAIEALTVESPGARFTKAVKFGSWDGKTRFLSRPGNRFLAGLRFRLQRALEAKGFEVRVQEQEPEGMRGIAPPGYKLLDPTRKTEGTIPLRAMQEDAVLAIKTRRRIIIKCPTGGGKSLLGAEACRVVGGPVLWLVHRKALLDQTVDYLTALFRGSPKTSITAVGGGYRYTPGAHITVAMVQSALSIVRDWEAFRTLVVDEVHHLGAETTFAIASKCTHAYFRIGLSGTPETPDPVKNMRLEGQTGEIVEVATTEGLADLGFLARPTIQFLSPPRSSFLGYPMVRDAVLPDWRRDPRRLVHLGGKLFGYAYEVGITRNLARHKTFFTQLISHFIQGERILILCNRIAHGEALLDLALASRTINGRCWWINGQDQSPQADAARRAAIQDFQGGHGGRLLIATTGVLGEGINLPEIDVLALMAGGVTEIGLLQWVGRSLRPRPDKNTVLIYDALDGESPFGDKDYLAEHTLSRIGTYLKQGFEVLGLPPNILIAAKEMLTK